MRPGCDPSTADQQETLWHDSWTVAIFLAAARERVRGRLPFSQLKQPQRKTKTSSSRKKQIIEKSLRGKIPVKVTLNSLSPPKVILNLPSSSQLSRSWR